MPCSSHTLLLYSIVILILPFLTNAEPPLNVIKITETPNRVTSPPRGWNSFGLQANPKVNPSFVFNQSTVKIQADALVSLIPQQHLTKHDYYISLDSGWNDGSSGDEYGRIVHNKTLFDIPEFAAYLHGRRVKLGIYVLPGAFCADENKTIIGTDSTIKDIFSKPITNIGFARCDLDYSKPLAQTWHDSVVKLFADWYVFPYPISNATSNNNPGHRLHQARLHNPWLTGQRRQSPTR